MEAINVARLNACCLALLDQVERTGQPILVTRRGKPLAQVSPVAPVGKRRIMGCMEGTAKIAGDIESPGNQPQRGQSSSAGHDHLRARRQLNVRDLCFDTPGAVLAQIEEFQHDRDISISETPPSSRRYEQTPPMTSNHRRKRDDQDPEKTPSPHRG